MKKTALVAAILTVAAIAFTSCNKGGAAKKESAANRIITVGYAQVGHESAWRNANTESFKSTFIPENNYNFLFNDADGNIDVQIAAVKDYIARNVDYIVIAPVVEVGWDQILKEAKEAAIPVILSDRQIKISDDSLYLCWVGGNFLKEGEDAATWLDQYILLNKLTDKRFNIVDLQGTIGASAQIGRTKGIEAGINSHPNWNLVAQKSGNFTFEGGKAAMEEIIKAAGIGKIDVVFAENDDMALGAIEAIKAAGKVPGKDIIIICFDAGHEAFVRMISGEINCAVECNPLHGPRVDEIIKTLENGGTVDRIQYVKEGVFDQRNAAEALPSRTY